MRHRVRHAPRRRLGTGVLAALLLLGNLAVPATAVATTRYVALAPAASGNTSCAAPGYNSIQAAVDAASAGDTIHICTGTYTLTETINVPVDLTFVGDGRANTRIDRPENSQARFRVFSAAGRTVTLRSLYARGLLGNDADGGVIDAANVAVDDASLDGAGRDGGAVHATGDVTVVDSQLLGFADRGGTIFAAGNVTVTRGTFDGTTEFAVPLIVAGSQGGAIYATRVTVTDSTFTRGLAQLGGGAIFATESVTATGTTFDSNTTEPAIPIFGVTYRPGGAINAPTVTVTTSTLTNNKGSRGGAIFATTVTVTGSTFTKNSANLNPPPPPGGVVTEIGGEGGAIYADTVTATDSTFDQNIAYYLGGGIDARKSATLTRTTFTQGKAAWGGGGLTVAIPLDPTSPGGILPKGTLTVDHSLFSENKALNGSGGAIAFFADPTITDTSFSKNRAEAPGGFTSPMLERGFGGAIWAGGYATIKSSTFEQNHSDNFGGAFYGLDLLTVENSTFSENDAGLSGLGVGGAIMTDGGDLTNNTFFNNTAGDGGALFVDPDDGVPATITNNVFAHTTATNACGNVPIDGGGNVVTDTSCGLTVASSHVVTLASLALGSLAENGGRTKTIAIGGTSAAVGAAVDPSCPAKDQRGVLRPQGTHCDAGAFEYIYLPTIAKSFTPPSVPLGSSSLMTITVTNPGGGLTMHGISFTDALPTGMTVPSGQAVDNTCGGQPANTASTVTLTGGSLAGGASCAVSISVTGSAAGTYLNTTGRVSSTEGGTGETASATLTVVAPPEVAKAFNPPVIPINGTSTLTFTIANPAANTVALAGVGLVDSLPAGVTVATSSSAACGGTLTTTSPSSIVLTGGSLAGGASCAVSISVTGSAAGTYLNTTGRVSSTEGGTGETASATLTVVAPPEVAKAFNPPVIPINGTSTLTFTIANPAANTVALAGVGLVDSLPAGVTVATSSSAACGGTLTTTSPSSIVLTEGSIGVGASCQFSVTVTGTIAGPHVNTTNHVTSSNGGTGNTASASLSVPLPPLITKSFSPGVIVYLGISRLTFTISNPNAVPLTGVGFTDVLPFGLLVALPNGLLGSCGGGTVSGPITPTVIQLTGATLAAGASCTFSVNILGAVRGLKTNVVSATAAVVGQGPSSTASLVVTDSDLAIEKSHSGSMARGRIGSYTIVVRNLGPAPTYGTVKVRDSLPFGMAAVAVTAPGWSCSTTWSSLECTRSDSLAMNASYPAITFTVRPGLLSPSRVVNVAEVSGGGDRSNANNSSADPTDVTS